MNYIIEIPEGQAIICAGGAAHACSMFEAWIHDH